MKTPANKDKEEKKGEKPVAKLPEKKPVAKEDKKDTKSTAVPGLNSEPKVMKGRKKNPEEDKKGDDKESDNK